VCRAAPDRYGADPAIVALGLDSQSMVSHEPRRPRVLVIDDQANIRDLVCELLRLLAFEADGAPTGAEGLALLEAGTYDLVVTDLMMPGMTGWEVAEAVRKRAPGLGVIMATASVSNLDPERVRELGLTLLPKPFQLEDLQRAVEQTLRPGAGVASARPIQEAAATQDVPVGLLGNLRATLEALHKAVPELEVALGAVERLIREREEFRARWVELERRHEELRNAHDALVHEHQPTVAALAQLQAEHEVTVQVLGEVRDQYQTLMHERQLNAEALQAIVRRLRR